MSSLLDPCTTRQHTQAGQRDVRTIQNPGKYAGDSIFYIGFGTAIESKTRKMYVCSMFNLMLCLSYNSTL